ncbi:MAG TPA: hypothetical protein GX706_01410 [Candidatus Moranbacteria bacterium]|nr:hypothetical protein [Candidatus Moranbacteria bacterium]
MNNKIFSILSLVALFSVGCFGIINGLKRVQQVDAAPNCPAGFYLVGDFCISGEKGSVEWKNVARNCHVFRKSRLCSSAELTAAFTVLSNKSNRENWSGSWSSDLVVAPDTEGGDDSDREAIYINYPSGENKPVEIEKEAINEVKKYHCCRDL